MDNEQLAKPEILYLAWPTVMAYLRIATHPRIFESPLSPSEAMANMRDLLAQPLVRPLAEKEGFLEEYEEVSAGMAARGNLVPDAHLAALMRQHGVRTIYTHNSDFRKFDFLDARYPLRSAR